MTVRVNGEEHDLAPSRSVDALLATLDLPRGDVAVAVDGTVVPRSQWGATHVPDGSSVEVVTAMQGG